MASIYKTRDPYQFFNRSVTGPVVWSEEKHMTGLRLISRLCSQVAKPNNQNTHDSYDKIAMPMSTRHLHI